MVQFIYAQDEADTFDQNMGTILRSPNRTLIIEIHCTFVLCMIFIN